MGSSWKEEPPRLGLAASWICEVYEFFFQYQWVVVQYSCSVLLSNLLGMSPCKVMYCVGQLFHPT